MPGISVALATHNGEKFLPEQLQSIAQQTTPPAELVVCDDCSQDRTVEIVRDFTTQASFPVRLETADARLGYRRNFMRAAELCSGELIAFCDQDDVWNPGKLAVMQQPFEDAQVLLAYHNAVLVDSQGAPRGRLYRGASGSVTFPPLTRHPWLTVPGFTQVFRRELMQFSTLHAASHDLDWPQEPLAHDQWFVLLASVLGSIVFVRQPLANYRQHGENVFGAYRDRRARYDHLIGAERFVRAASAAANNRSEILQQLQDMTDGDQHRRAGEGAEFYGLLGRRLAARTAVYASESYGARLSALYALVMSGGYGRARSRARFTAWDFLMDFYIAATLGPRLRRLLRQ